MLTNRDVGGKSWEVLMYRQFFESTGIGTIHILIIKISNLFNHGSAGLKLTGYMLRKASKKFYRMNN